MIEKRASGPQRRGRESQGERRTVTILFCDVTGSTAIAERLDPEDWAEIMDEAFQHMTDAINRYEGSVAKFMGDGLLAFFGAPRSHEDDPQRAILAALDITHSLVPFCEELKLDYGFDFNVRIGINTGLVVFGTIGSGQAGEKTAMGDAVNLAARMEQTAEPGTIQVSENTHRLVSPFFEFAPRGEIELKGKKKTSCRLQSRCRIASNEPVRDRQSTWLDTICGATARDRHTQQSAHQGEDG